MKVNYGNITETYEMAIYINERKERQKRQKSYMELNAK